MQTTFENSKPEISCIYVNYRSVSWLEQSLESLIQFEQVASYEILVVNNDENDQEELERVAKKFPLKIIPAFHNPGFGASANRGVREANGQILFFVNPDTKWRQAFFVAVLERFKKEECLGALGIQLVSPGGKKELPTSEFTLVPFFLRRRSEKEKFFWASGGALFVKKELFLELGGFDERFFMYFEDMDLSLRLHQSGYQVVVAPELQITHYGGQSHPNKKSQKALYDQSLYRYVEKHWPKFLYLLFRGVHPFYRFLFPYGRH